MGKMWITWKQWIKYGYIFQKYGKHQHFDHKGKEEDIHSKKKNIHRTKRKESFFLLWILWKTKFLKDFPRFYAHLRPP